MDDCAAVLVAQPHAGESSGLLHFHVANVGFMRQQILGEFSGLGIQPDSKIVVHSGRPEHRSCHRTARRRDASTRVGVFHSVIFCVFGSNIAKPLPIKCATPHAVLGIDVSSPAAAPFGREVIPNGFQRLAVGHPDLVVIHVHAVDVVLRVRNNIVGVGARAAGRIGYASPGVGRQVDVPGATRLAGARRRH